MSSIFEIDTIFIVFQFQEITQLDAISMSTEKQKLRLESGTERSFGNNGIVGRLLELAAHS